MSESYTGAVQVAKQFPQAQAQQIVAAAKDAFVQGKSAALIFATLTAAVGFLLVVWLFPKKDEENAIYESVSKRDVI
jgi:hypothetical protein